MYDSITAPPGEKGRGVSLAGVASSRRNVGSAAFGGADNRQWSTQSADVGGGGKFPVAVECVKVISRSEESAADVRRTSVFSSRRTATDNAGMNPLQFQRHQPTVNEHASAGMYRTRQLTNQPGVDPRHGSIRLETTVPDQSPCNDLTPACVSGTAAAAAATSWNGVIQTSSAELQLSSCRYDVDERSTASRPRHSPSSFWPCVSGPVVPPNYDLFPGLPLPFNDSTRSYPSTSQCWSDSDIMMDNWLYTNSNSARFDPADRSFLTSPL